MKYLYCLTISTFLFLLTACSNQSLYEAIQDNRVNECRNLTYQQEQACLKGVNQQSYEDYNRERGIEESSVNRSNDDLSFSLENTYKN